MEVAVRVSLSVRRARVKVAGASYKTATLHVIQCRPRTARERQVRQDS